MANARLSNFNYSSNWGEVFETLVVMLIVGMTTIATVLMIVVTAIVETVTVV